MRKDAKDLSEAIKAAVENAENNPEYVEDIEVPVKSFFQIEAMSPGNQPIYSAVLDALGIPVRFTFNEHAYGAYQAQMKSDEDSHDLQDEHINISTMFYELLKNSSSYGVFYPKYEMAFVYAHELYHARFRHLNKQKILNKEYPMPHVVYNVVFDILINTLLKYNEPLIRNCGNDAMNLVMFKNGMRYYENIDDLKNSVERAKSVLGQFGISTDEKELGALNVLASKEIEKFTDDELAQLMYHHFQDFFDKYQEMFNEAMEECSNEDSSQNGSSSTSDDDNQDSNEDSKDESLQDRVMKRFEEKMKQKASEDEDFAESMKRFVANFSDIPSPQVQMTIETSMQGGVMSPDEIAEAVRGQQVMQDAVTEAEEKFAGTLPGFVRSFANVKPKRPSYLAQLQSFGNRHIGETKKTFSPPNKKHSRTNLIIPSKVGTALDIAFIIDTSGSMQSDEIMPAIAQINAILRNSPSSSRLHVMFNDTQVQHEVLRGRNTKKFEKILEKGVQGSGGSVFDEVFRHKALRKVDAIVFLSDFYIFIPDTLSIKQPLILLHTENYNKDVMEEVMTRAKHSMSVPIGRLD